MTSFPPDLQGSEMGETTRLSRALITPQFANVDAGQAAKSSWMAPGAGRQDLLYVSDFVNNVVDVYTYPTGNLVGALGGFSGPEGSCTDADRNVWITSQNLNSILEYGHGGTKPIRVLTQPGQLLDGCSVDLATGTLAVDSFCQKSGYACVAPGSVFIYTDIKSPPQQYTDPDIWNMYFCGYDGKGDLFVDGSNQPYGVPFVLAELSKSSSVFTNISLNRIIYYPGGVQWDGKYLAVGDQEAGNQFTSSVHQISVSGPNGTIVSTTKLKGSDDVTQFWIQGKKIVTPNIARQSDVRIFEYPRGGAPLVMITGPSEPIGATVSLAGHTK